MNKIKMTLLKALIVVGVTAMAPLANAATTYGFQYLGSPAEKENNLESQLSLVVDSHGANGWDLTVNNLGPIPSNIAEIYFYSTTKSFFSGFSVESDSGIDVTLSNDAVAPRNLSGFDNKGWFLSFAVDNGSCGDCGVGIGEWVKFHATSGYDLLAALNSGMVKAGLHIRSISPTDGSDSYVNGGNPVPLPAAAWLFGSALLGFIGFSVRRRV